MFKLTEYFGILKHWGNPKDIFIKKTQLTNKEDRMSEVLSNKVLVKAFCRNRFIVDTVFKKEIKLQRFFTDTI